MSDFELSQALDGPEINESKSASSCSEMMVKQDGTFRLDEEVELVLSHKPQSLQRVANLVMAITRMKRSLSAAKSDEQVCSVIMESLVEERVIKRVENFTTGQKKTFQRLSSVRQCTLCDRGQKDIVQSAGDIKLQAITLKGGYGHQKLWFIMSRFASPCPSPDAGQTVALSIRNSSWYISCSMIDDKAVLLLEQCSDEDLKAVSAGTITERFLFAKRTVGRSLTSFESVKCRGWFISTSSEGENQPVAMCRVEVDRASRYISFNIN